MSRHFSGFRRVVEEAIIVLSGCLFILTGCSKDFSVFEEYPGAWISGITFYNDGQDIPHDGRIYETDHILVFSDASSDAVKMKYARMAEASFRELLSAFDIPDAAELGIRRRENKLTIYANRYRNINQQSFPNGFILYALDSPVYLQWSGWDDLRYRRQVKHETMHVMQYLFGLTWHRLELSQYPETWLSEGLAETVSGGVYPPITSVQQVDTWMEKDDHVNPISIHFWTDYPVPHERVNEYYPMFGLAVRCLLDPSGLGKTLADVKAMFLTLGTGRYKFTEAFHQHMGLSVEEFETQFPALVSSVLGSGTR